ncbi:MAG: zinc ribbon domain-containing protein [Candidatus Omnitrophica bacterium]|nr:zinc ribbon domain-containing protein [Candidatus Omnitrophota bacterium]MCF7893693.1 zinc ribbon domain-containing protein [Candidatus Omnitrophota bacterium]
MPEDFFDYKQITEQKEGLDYNQLVECPYCHKPIPKDAINCYYCGKPVDFGKRSSWVYWTVFILIIVLLSYFIFFN